MGRKCARQMGQRRARCGAEACRDLGRAGMRGGGVPELGAWAHRTGPMGWSTVEAGRADGVEVCRADGAEAACQD